MPPSAKCPSFSRLAVCLLLVAAIAFVAVDVRAAKDRPQPVRLAGGGNPWSGRLEVYYKRRREYGTVCDDGWHMNASHVACRMMGYAEAVDFHYANVFGAGTGVVVLDDVLCTGNESSLFACQHAKLGQSNCYHNEDIGLTCSQDSAEERLAARRAAVSIRRRNKVRKDRRKIQARLVGESKLQPRSFGVVELMYKGKWRTVCGEGWDTQDARVLCGMLGFKDSLPLMDGYQESGNFQRHKAAKFTNFQCTGSEVLIGSCPFDDLQGAGACPSEAVAHAHCHRGDFVLDTPYDENGLPVLGFVDEDEADEEADNALDGGGPGGESYGAGVGGLEEIAEPGVREEDGDGDGDKDDDGEEETTTTHAVDGGVDSNTTAELAPGGSGLVTEVPDDALVLQEDEARRRKGKSKIKSTRKSPLKAQTKKPKPIIRLKSGPNYGEGRVEVYINGYWGTVCSDGWDTVDASVACRQLGFGVAKEAVPNAEFGQGVGPIWLWRMRCEGHEKTLADCGHGYLNGSTCTHSMDAGLRCVVPDINATSKLRLEGGTYEKEGRVAVYTNGMWGNICGFGWNLLAAKVVCRQLGMGHARYGSESTLSYGAAPKRPFVMMDVQCTGHERTIRECKYARRSRRAVCEREFRAGVVCVEALSDVLMDLHVLQSSVRVQDWPETLMTCAREEGCLSDVPNNWGLRRLLRFTSAIMNRGMEQFRPFLSRYSWIWHSCHRHFHSMEVFSHYDLLNQKGEPVAQGHKASFCLEDGHCDDGATPQFSCINDQGISVNCIDIYASNIDCQWVDITGVRTDLYILRIHINPDNKVAESDYDNNLIECDLYYGGSAVMIGHCEYVCDRMTDE